MIQAIVWLLVAGMALPALVAFDQQHADQIRQHFDVDIKTTQKSFDDATADFKSRKINREEFQTKVTQILCNFYDLIIDPNLTDQTVRDSLSDKIVNILKKLRNRSISMAIFITDKISNDLLEFVEKKIIPGRILKQSKPKLAEELFFIAGYWIDQNQLDRALQLLEAIKKLDNDNQSPISSKILQNSELRRYTIAEKYLKGIDVEKDVDKALKLLMEIIDTRSHATTPTRQYACTDIFQIVFDKLEKPITEEELDSLSALLQKIVNGASTKTTTPIKEKAQLNLIDIAVRYESMEINNRTKAREILSKIAIEGLTPRLRKTARDSLK